MTRVEWQQRYQNLIADYTRLKEEAEFILQKRIAAKGIKLHSLTSRVKSLTSLEDKAQRKGYTEPLEQASDLVGVRAVVLFRSDLSKVEKIIRSEFDVLGVSDTIASADDPSTFGYMSQHYEVVLPPSLTGARYEGLADIRFEVQLRSILMDAWANVSHHLAYKDEASIPVELRRDFNALSGLFYVADTHFEMFFEETARVRQRAGKQLTHESDDVPLNLDTLYEFLQKRFPDRAHTERTGVAELTNELQDYGFKTIGEIDRMLSSAAMVFAKHEKNRMSRSDGMKIQYTDIGVVRRSLNLTDSSYKLPIFKA